MGLSGDEDVEQRFSNLCRDLNMDRNSQEEAWESYRRIRTYFVLEVSSYIFTFILVLFFFYFCFEY